MARAAAVASTAMPRVNLLPPSEVARRERERLGRGWTWIVIAAVIVSLLMIGATWVWNQVAQQQLAAEQARTNTLIAEIGSLSDVSGALAAESELTGYLAEAMGSDLTWQDVRRKVESVLPADVSLVGFDLIPGAPSTLVQSDDEAAGAVGLAGTITLDSPNTIEIATISAALRQVDAIMLSDANAITESSIQEGRFTYTIDVTFDQSIYTARFAAEEGGE
ncbi:hypothetical protein [Microbacterium hydrocarbonoxydans]|uniref:hypothetical protein n=1 Tax=Microbacterium hydrocarbonoxydans TaxID=273678 RepID=UPI0007BC7F57|nr:hypothetical protein [Microbacterium hydrocarbonoxydans]GAT71636.1 type IV pilus biogenesis protein PilN [Microbacterium sp. HM58-2]